MQQKTAKNSIHKSMHTLLGKSNKYVNNKKGLTKMLSKNKHAGPQPSGLEH